MLFDSMEKCDDTEKLLWSLYDKAYRSKDTVNEVLKSLDMTMKGAVNYYMTLA